MGRSPKPSTPFAQRLILARGDATRAEIAKALGCPLETLGNYERGRTFPDRDMLERLKKVLGVSLDWLITGTGDMDGECPSAGLDEALFVEIADGIADVLRRQGGVAEASRVARLAVAWYNDLIATCASDDERLMGLRLMLRQLGRQGDDGSPATGSHNT